MARVLSIVRKQIQKETLHNLAVAEDESFVANGVVVHNCKSYIQPILLGKLGNREIEKLAPSKKSLEDDVQFHEHFDGPCKHRD